MTRSAGVRAFVLAGGASSRFGADKAGVRWRGMTLLDRALRVTASVAPGPRVVVREPWRVPSRGDAAVRGLVVGERPGLGPVEGLRAALRSCPEEWVLVTGVDMPGLSRAALRTLLHARAPDVDVVCFGEDSGRRHPLPGCYRRALLESSLQGTASESHRLARPGASGASTRVASPAGSSRLDGGGSLQSVLDGARVRLLRAPSPRDLANVNRPEDFVAFWDEPPTPNWVCSETTVAGHRVDPLRPMGSFDAAWSAAEAWLRVRDDVTVTVRTPSYLAAEFRIPVFGFVDDLELHRRDDAVAVRSASRTGHWDLGVNRRRVDGMRRALREVCS